MTTTIYTTDGCAHTELARRELAELGEPFEERDIADAPAAVKELAGLDDGTFITPVIVQENGVMRLGSGGI